jgi:hypothetical protein
LSPAYCWSWTSNGGMPMPESNAQQDRWVTITQTILQIVTLIVLALTSNRNHEAVKKVEANQAEVATRADETKETLDKRSTEVDTKLKAIEKTAARTEQAVTDTLGPQLWATVQYLQSVADESGRLEDRVRAEEARRAYVEHLKRMAAPKNGNHP